MSISGTGRTNPVISGRVYATIRYDGGSTSITGGSYNTSVSTRYGLGRHSLSASVDTENLMNFNDYSFDVGYSYQGDYVDLSLGLGCYNQFDSEAMRSAEKAVIEVARKYGKTAGMLLKPSMSPADCIERGFRFLAMGTDHNCMKSAFRQLLER